MDYQKISSYALALPVASRVKLAQALLLSLDAPDGAKAEIDAAWSKEIRIRLDDLERGDAVPIPFDQAIADIRARLNPHRSTG